jgi:hypothetical protein
MCTRSHVHQRHCWGTAMYPKFSENSKACACRLCCVHNGLSVDWASLTAAPLLQTKLQFTTPSTSEQTGVCRPEYLPASLYRHDVADVFWQIQ